MLIRLLCIGDSNGAVAAGWPAQLKKIVPDSFVVNDSESARAMGFDSCGKSTLNCLKIITAVLEKAQNKLTGADPDKIIFMLGTNDCKFVYEQRQTEIKTNLELLIGKIKSFFNNTGGSMPHIIIVTPPPMGSKAECTEKRRGGDKRTANIVAVYKKIAHKTGCGFVNVYDALKPDIESLTFDGVHLNEKGSYMVAQKIAEEISTSA